MRPMPPSVDRLPSVVVVAILVSSLTLTTCGGRGSEQEDGRVTITFWQFWVPEVIEPIIDRFEYEHPDIRVEVQQLTWQSGLEQIEVAVAAGTMPDLCELGSTWVPRFADSGVLADVTAAARRLIDGYRLWEAVTLNGRQYGFPWVVGTRALFLNREVFRQAKLDPDQPPETWEELLRAAARIDSLGPEVYGFGMNAGERYILYKKFMPFAWGNGGRILSGDHERSLVDSPAMIEALEFYVQLAEHALLEKQDVLDQAFREGRLGMQISGAWNLKRIPIEAPELDFDVALVPKPSPFSGTHASFAGGEVLVTFEGSRHRAAAIELARFLIRRENAVALCRVAIHVQPAARGAGDDPYYAARPRERLFVEQLETAVAPPAHAEWIRMEEILNTAIEEALHRRKTPREALEEASRRIDRLLARGRGRT